MFLMGLLTTMEEPVAYDKMSDEKLLLRVAEGDKAAFQQLYQNTDKTIYGFILSILRNPQDSEEVMQELYLKVWTSAGSYQSQGKPLAWMFTTLEIFAICASVTRSMKRISGFRIFLRWRQGNSLQIEDAAVRWYYTQHSKY